MTTFLTKADEEGNRCYLEASKYYPNVPIYERFGFKLVETIEMTDGGDSVKVVPCSAQLINRYIAC
jgi:hypothetical protein